MKLPGKGPVQRGLSILILAAFAAYIGMTAWKAFISPGLVEDFPDSLYLKVEAIPFTFDVHMVSGALALVLVPLAIAFSPRPRWHRPLARLTALCVLVAGATALPVALIHPVTLISGLGFAAQGLVWLGLLAMGIVHIRLGNVRLHRAMMLMLAAVTMGAVFFRFYLALFATFGSYRYFELFYAVDAWVAWGLPLIVTALLLKRTGGFRDNR